MIGMINFLLVLMMTLLSFPTTLSATEKEENIGTKTAVIFNTLCAKCHEGECSGRLSFDTGSEAAHTHIKRYAIDDNISESDIKEFFALLNHMKKECSLLMPDKEKPKPEDISRFAIPSRKAYFIPLGLLKKGTYSLILSAKEKLHYRVEVLSNHFDHFTDVSTSPDRKEKIHFTVDEPTRTFLRIQSKKTLHIQTIKLINNF